MPADIPIEDAELSAIDVSKGDLQQAGNADELASEEVAKLEKEKSEAEVHKLQAEVTTLQIKNEGLVQDAKARDLYAGVLFAFTCVWLSLIVSIVISVGLKGLTLSDIVLVTLIGTTTVNALFFFGCVTRYIFPSDKKRPKRKTPAKEKKTDMSKYEKPL